ncbi:mitochondrial carrier domain-containing protein [Linnemannia elongata]|nr:mitochondrial carrier domain-containing protein [Linnemannia elongata]KAK5796992.1 mitochondrial carrier domain-containing protein [Linnemannia elongata]
MSGPQHIVGLSLFGPLVLTVATAPANRVRLLLQTQDEIVLNLREESLAHHHRHTSSSSSSSSSNTKPYNLTNNDSSKATTEEQEDDDDDEEPRSIIAPYAQLPYADMQDCYQRLLEKEGRAALWRGYSVEVGRIFLQKSIETRLSRRGTFALRRWMSLTPPNAQGGGVGVGWMLATAVEGTLVGAAAMAVVYPLAVLHAKMATDVRRRTRTVHKVILKPASVPTTIPAPVVVQEEKEKEGEALAVESSTESISRDSVEWVDHTAEWANHQDQDQDQKDPTVGTPILEGPLSVSEPTPQTTTVAATTTTEEKDDGDQERSYTTVTYDLSHKYRTFRQIYREIIASSEGYLGLYKGFSTVIASAFISRLGMMTIYTFKSFCAGPSGTVSISPFQVFFAQTALSVVTYPLTTVGNRRMIAAPGRYSSSWEAAKEIVEKQGWQALFRGVEVVVLRSVVLAALSQMLL